MWILWGNARELNQKGGGRHLEGGMVLKGGEGGAQGFVTLSFPKEDWVMFLTT